MANAPDAKKSRRLIHIIIGLIIMFVFRFLPNLPDVTDPGMNMIGVFIGTLYLWFTIDTLTGSLISFVMICFSGYAGIGAVLTGYMNITLVQAIFMMIMAGALVTTNVTQYVARFFLTVRINRGRPWVFAAMVCLGSFFLSAFADWLAPIFLFWPILYEIFEEVGYKKGEKFPIILVVLVVLGDVMGYHVFPFMRNPLTLIANYQALTAENPDGPIAISNGGYMTTAFVCSFLIILIAILVSKFIFRPDTSKIKNFDIDSLNANPLPKMSKQQKIVSVVFILVLIFLIFPALLSSIPFFGKIASYSLIIGVIGVTVLCVLQADGKPVINFGEIVKKNVSWEMIAMIATALLLASALTNEATGVTAFLNKLLSPAFSGMGYKTFFIIILIVTIVLTNFCNSFVIGVVMSPIVATYCSATGTNAAPIMMMVIFTTLSTAIGTPSASPFAATLYGNSSGWAESKKIYKYSLTYILIEAVILLVIGIPMASALV